MSPYWRKRLLATCGAVAAFLLLDRLFPPDLTRYRDTSVLVLDRDGVLLRPFTTKDGMWRLAAGPGEVDRSYLAMLTAIEDRRFYHHPGVDPLALARASWQMLRAGHVVSGGSTLTMQVARLLMPHRHNLIGKIHDIIRALQLEERFGKDEILSMYLTLAPFGGNIEGARAASLIYFDREPTRLSTAESALLVALPQRPTQLRPDRFPERSRQAELKILRRLSERGLLSYTELAEAEEALPHLERHALPFLAPHLADRLKYAGRPVRTTIDATLQHASEQLAARELPWFGDAANMAALVVDNRDGGVLAYLGGARFFETNGEVDLAQARRSPGSTLKPFIYGIAFDDLIVLPDTLIEDRPMRFADYAPQNFDRWFHGDVTVREALQQSYNLPAIELLDRIGPARLAAKLRQAGAVLSFPSRQGTPGLPLALGGVGISLADLTMLYAGIAHGGEVRGLHYLAGEADGAPVPIMERRGAWLVTDILRESPLPNGLASPVLSRADRPIAYKTGTSYGFRDAWAIGFTPSYTVGVWVGRVEGTPRPGSYGRNTAAPLLFKLFDLLPAETMEPEARPAGIADTGSSDLPPGLHHFTRASHLAEDFSDDARPRILFPPDGAIIELAHRNVETGPLSLQAEGGAPPYSWAVNGLPLPTQHYRSTAQWQPDGLGFVHVTVTDAKNRIASADVRLK